MAAEVHPLHPGRRPADGASDDEVLTAVAQEVLDGLEDLVPRMGAAYRREVAEYAAMDDETFALVLRTSEAFVRRFVAALAAGVTQPVPEHEVLVGSGRRRQRDGISLDAAMHAFRIASRVGWTGIADASTAIAPHLISELAGRWIEYADRASTAFAEGHTSASSEQLRRLDARRHALLADVLAAEDEVAARAVAAGHGTRLAARYVPVLIAASAARSEDALAPQLAPGSLLGRRGGHLLALVPDDGDPGRVLRGLALDGLVVRGRASAPGVALRAALGEVEAVLATATALGRSGLHGPDDLTVHRAVREHRGLARDLRTRVLLPLLAADADGIFLETLRAYLEDGAVRTVADRLFVHANTVTYRLRRVRELTGLDARVPVQAAQLVLAVALLDAADGPTEPTTTEAQP